MAIMTHNRATDRLVARACSLTHVATVASAAHVATAPTAAIAMPTTTNLWLGDVQSKGFGSKYATKRLTPGRLEGMT